MKEPKRLSQSGSDSVTRLLLEAGRTDAPSNDRLGRMLGGVAGAGVALSAQAATAAAAVAAPVTQSAVPVMLVVKWLGLGAFAGMIVSAGAAEVLPAGTDSASDTSSSAPPARAVGPEQAARVTPPDPRAAVEAPASEARPPASTVGRAPRASAEAAHRFSASVAVAENSRATPAVVAQAAATEREANEGKESRPDPDISPETRALREEVAVLGLAKAALNRGAAAEALAIVRSYHTRFPQGRLGPEAAYIEMEAAHSTGNLKRARAIAEQLAGGTTPNAHRARAILEGTPP